MPNCEVCIALYDHALQPSCVGCA